MSRLRLLVLLGLMVGIFAFAGAAYCTRDGRIVCVPGDTGLCGGTGGGPPTATATPSPEPCPAQYQGRCYAIGMLKGNLLSGAFSRFAFESYSTNGKVNQHSNHTLWVLDNTLYAWCEVGFTRGYSDPVTGEWLDANSVYVASNDEVAGYREQVIPSFRLGSYGTVHAYQMFRVNSTDLNAQVWVDVTQLGTCPLPLSANATETGLEYTDEHAVNQGVSPYDLQVLNAGGGWTHWYDTPDRDDRLCRVGAYSSVRWISQEVQFTDSSNVIAQEGPLCP